MVIFAVFRKKKCLFDFYILELLKDLTLVQALKILLRKLQKEGDLNRLQLDQSRLHLLIFKLKPRLKTGVQIKRPRFQLRKRLHLVLTKLQPELTGLELKLLGFQLTHRLHLQRTKLRQEPTRFQLLNRLLPVLTRLPQVLMKF